MRTRGVTFPRLLALACVLVVVACGPPINDLARLPERISICGWDWKHDTTISPMTLADVGVRVGAKPVVVDLSSGLCPAGACTIADIRAGGSAAPCQRVVWARVGLDSYVEYAMVFQL